MWNRRKRLGPLMNFRNIKLPEWKKILLGESMPPFVPDYGNFFFHFAYSFRECTLINSNPSSSFFAFSWQFFYSTFYYIFPALLSISLFFPFYANFQRIWNRSNVRKSFENKIDEKVISWNSQKNTLRKSRHR